MPDLLIYDYSGGAHCCDTVKHIICSNPPVLVAQLSGCDGTPIYKQLTGDGHFELVIADDAYAYWNASFMASPAPETIFRIRNGHYEIAGDLMRQRAPSAQETATTLKELQHRLSRYDLFLARNNDPNQVADVKLTPEEQADDDFFGLEGWYQNDVCIPPAVWRFLLDLIYSGQIDQAVDALDTMWPPGKSGKNEFANDLLDMILRGSWFGGELPWAPELETAFEQHFPAPILSPENKPTHR